LHYCPLMKTMHIVATLALVGACAPKPAASSDPNVSGASTATPTPTSASAGASADCGKVDAVFTIPSCCGGSPKYYWDGTTCAATTDTTMCGCSCTGRDCGRFFGTKDVCESVYRSCRK
jgi:hypothetical protein